MLAPFSPAFLSGDPRAPQFLAADFRDAKARTSHVRNISQRSTASKALIEALLLQDRRWPPSAPRRLNLEALGQAGTVAVVTGQQVALFLGPLYSFYKAASAVAVARALELETGTRCVPVFWLQTEDHDFEEINHCHTLNSEAATVKLQLEDHASVPHADRVSVEHRLLGASVTGAVQQLEACLEQLPHAREVLELIRAHYRPSASLADAFGGTLASLFAEEGLILLDPRDPSIAQLTASVHRRAVASAGPISGRLLQRERALRETGFEAQVHVRQGSPLSFFHLGAAEGARFRMVPEGPNWSLVGADASVPDSEVARHLEDDPLRFSSSALLRPIIQDTLLPTAAYVAGPGEINYFAQLAPLYDFFELPQPLVVPRARFRLLEPRTVSLLKALHLTPSQVERPRDDILRSIGSAVPPELLAPQVVEERLRADTGRTLNELEQAAPLLAPDVAVAIRRTRGTIDRAISRLVGRYKRALLESDRVATDRVDRLQNALFPQGVPQERFQSLPYFASKFGVAALKEKMFANLVPFAAETRDLPL